MDAGEQLVGGGVHRGPAVDHEHAELLVEPPEALAARDRHDPARGQRRLVAVAREPCAAVGHLLVHVGDVEAGDLADGLEQRRRPARVVGVDVHAQSAVVTHHENGVPDLLQQRHESPAVEPLASDGEVRAVAEARRLVLGMVQRRRRVLVLELGGVLAAQRGEAAGEDDGQPVRTRVDDARFAQNRELVGTALDGLRAGLEGTLEHRGQQLVLLGGRGGGSQAPRVHVSEVVRHAARHRPDGGEHRPLGGIAYRGVRRVRRPGEGGRHQDRVDELPAPARELLGRAAHDLREDHAAVAASPEERRPRHSRDDHVAADHVDGLAVQVVQFDHDGAHGERHVVAGVAVRDREHVQVVDLLAPTLQLGERCGHHAPEADEALVWHRGFVHHRAAALLRG